MNSKTAKTKKTSHPIKDSLSSRSAKILAISPIDADGQFSTKMFIASSAFIVVAVISDLTPASYEIYYNYFLAEKTDHLEIIALWLGLVMDGFMFFGFALNLTAISAHRQLMGRLMTMKYGSGRRLNIFTIFSFFLGSAGVEKTRDGCESETDHKIHRWRFHHARKRIRRIGNWTQGV
ncbi:unnamed protein product [Nesidiocoris tenuis]|uniref:Uncharacterized protein n=1 Tax=Nesidiocoris tenuis TaxID=355587 RepID=A0A6H5GCW0_9HEMI|nr:unnamed protein product [Nesidiocoris tenuis]